MTAEFVFDVCSIQQDLSLIFPVQTSLSVNKYLVSLLLLLLLLLLFLLLLLLLLLLILSLLLVVTVIVANLVLLLFRVHSA